MILLFNEQPVSIDNYFFLLRNSWSSSKNFYLDIYIPPSPFSDSLSLYIGSLMLRTLSFPLCFPALCCDIINIISSKNSKKVPDHFCRLEASLQKLICIVFSNEYAFILISICYYTYVTLKKNFLRALS